MEAVTADTRGLPRSTQPFCSLACICMHLWLNIPLFRGSIERLVHELHELTDEEIKIVEENT